MSASHIAHGGAGGRHVRNSSPLASGNAGADSLQLFAIVMMRVRLSAADAQPFVIGHTVPSVVLTGALSPSAIGQAFHLKSYTGPDPKRRGPVKAGHATQV